MTLQELIDKYNKWQSKFFVYDSFGSSVEIPPKRASFNLHSILIYSFIYKKNFKFLDFFHADTEVQTDFWKWMESHYDTKISKSKPKYKIYIYDVCLYFNDYEEIPKIMLEGYIRQYVEQLIEVA